MPAKARAVSGLDSRVGGNDQDVAALVRIEQTSGVARYESLLLRRGPSAEARKGNFKCGGMMALSKVFP
jgi:hypothetical protein